MVHAPLQHSDEYASTLRQMGVKVESGLCGPEIRKRFPVFGTITYLPRATGLPHPRPNGTLLINARDAAVDLNFKTNGLLPVMTPQTLAILDLEPDEPKRLEAMHGKWRNRLRAAQSGPLRLSVATFDPRVHDWLLDHESEQRRKKHYTALPHCFVRHYPQAKTLIVTAHLGMAPVAAMLFLLHPPGATYHIGWSGPAGRSHNAHTLILWHASQLLRRKGVTQLDLGTLDTIHAPGLARFKLGSGAKPVIMGHTWVSLPGLSPLICAIRRRGGFLSGLFSKGSIGGPRTSQETPHGSAQHRNYRPR